MDRSAAPLFRCILLVVDTDSSKCLCFQESRVCCCVCPHENSPPEIGSRQTDLSWGDYVMTYSNLRGTALGLGTVRFYSHSLPHPPQ